MIFIYITIFCIKSKNNIGKNKTKQMCLINVQMITYEQYGVIAQLVERLLSMQEALGSTPSNSIIFIYNKHCPIFRFICKNVSAYVLSIYSLNLYKNIIKCLKYKKAPWLGIEPRFSDLKSDVLTVERSGLS